MDVSRGIKFVTDMRMTICPTKPPLFVAETPKSHFNVAFNYLEESKAPL